MLVRFTIPGDPVAKGRARSVTRRGKGGASYIAHITPEKTEQYEARVAVFAQQAMAGAPLIDGPCELDLSIFVRIPESWSQKKKTEAANGSIKPTTKPDCSNILKAIEDAMNGVVWVDDKQIVSLRIRKSYAPAPCVCVTVTSL